MRIVSWNVNGIRAAARKGLLDWIGSAPPDLVCLQEVKANETQFDTAPLIALGYRVLWHAAEKPGYSGVVTLARVAVDSVKFGLGEHRFDAEGRVVVTDHGDLTVINAYFPNAQRDLARLDYKTDFYRHLLAFCAERRAAGRRIIIGGDWNTAHRPIDLKNWRANQCASGFTPGERALVDEYLADGYVDAFRHLHPETEDQFTWWAQRAGVRERNIGWRIDYHLIDRGLLPRLAAARLHMSVPGSDHCPVELEIE